MSDVRAAYRLLHDYQRRILDIVQFIGNKYNRTFYQSIPKFSDRTPTKNDKHLDRWSWDWLNLYYTEFKFETYFHLDHQFHFGILVVSDDGYYRTENIQKNEVNWRSKSNKVLYSQERIDIDKFEEASLSDSKLILIAGINLFEAEGVFGNSFNLPELILSAEGNHENESGRMLFQSYSLSEINDQQALEEVLSDFEDTCLLQEVLISIPTNLQ